MNSPKVLILVERVPPMYSGAGQRAYRHAKYLYDQGALSKLIINCKYDHIINSLPKKFVKELVLPDRFRNSIFNHFSFNIAVLIFLIRNKSKFNIIHSFIDTYKCLAAVIFSKIMKKNIIVEFTLLPDINKRNKKWITRKTREFVLNNCNLVVCISNALAEWCMMNGITKSNISVIPNDTDMTIPEKVNLTIENQFQKYRGIILCAGPQIYRKGFDIAIETFKLLKMELPDLGLIWLGPKNNTINIKGKIERIEDIIPNEFIQIGKVDNMTDYYHLATATLFPSRREGFGNVIIESMACGTPVVATHLKGVTDTIITNGVDGILISGENPADFAQAIIKLFSDKEYYNRVKMAGLQTIDNKYRTPEIMKSYIQAYSSLCS